MQIKKLCKENIVRIVFCFLIIVAAFGIGFYTGSSNGSGKMGKTVERLGALIKHQATTIEDINRQLSAAGLEVDELTQRNEDITREVERLTESNRVYTDRLKDIDDGLSIDIEGIRELKAGIRAYINQTKDD